MQYLSYILDENTPTYGNRNKFSQVKKSDIFSGDVANDTTIETTVHIGTHIDMPYHFFQEGQTIESYNADFWRFSSPLIVEIEQSEMIIKDRLLKVLKNLKEKEYDILIVKTGICHKREKEVFWKENFGFHPDVAEYLRKNIPSIRVIGFDSISVSSFSKRMLGREAHKAFLNPEHPILLLEDMDLREVNKKTKFKEIIVAPMRIANCDGLPCTIFGVLDD